MGCAGSKSASEVEAKSRNDAIDTGIKKDRERLKHEIKMLLLGAGDSGKSTVLKQFKLIHLNGFNAIERDAYREIVFANTIQSMRTILEALSDLGITLAPEKDPHRAALLALPAQFEGNLLPWEISDALRELWNDPGIKEAVRRSREFQLIDSAEYYFKELDRLSAPEYIPSDQDILRTRVKTTGITETKFKIGELTYRIFDVGGQRSERRKWVHCFENVAALVFLVGLSEYDQRLSEDRSVNRMDEALTLFESICNSRWFQKSSIILFLNKTDLLREKLPWSPLGAFYKDYSGGNNYDAACEYFRHKFISLNKRVLTKQIFTHYTCATDTQQIKFVLSAVQDIMLKMHLKESGLI
ncbi:heterotrimeric G-protein alpha subunit, GPA1-like protein [Roridomyces roridus]|uniref:Heterotrimeric G-protein alpha subunit, GPA1-like protein n=1 Tax=Roridomyces roridus TaxID=1738132 RepID=A0AAD7FFZ7_9AGAR|nr:heterotrimeric G-protein alpha subunit, GPA1-like protein [Roridomyces roridus]